MASFAHLSKRLPNRSILNKFCSYSHRSIATFTKWHCNPSMIIHSNNILSHSHINIPHRSMTSATQKDEQTDKENENESEQNAESEESEQSDEEIESSNEQITELQNKLESMETELKKYKDALARSHADIINIQNMNKKDVENARKFATRSFSKDILAVADSLDKCIEVVAEHLNDGNGENVDQNIKSVIDGVKITQSTLLDTFERHGITKINALHQPFDPNYHEALFKMPSAEHPEDTVVQVISEGYTIKDATLRATKVGVSTAPPTPPPTEEEENKE